jgi:hypothetical protein
MTKKAPSTGNLPYSKWSHCGLPGAEGEGRAFGQLCFARTKVSFSWPFAWGG